MSAIKIGDEVRLLTYSSRRARTLPEGGSPGTVTKVGRKYATATFGDDGREISFDMETGSERGGYGMYYVRTPEQLAIEQRRKEALGIIMMAGLEFRSGCHQRDCTLEQLEVLAEVVKTWNAPETSDTGEQK